MLSFIMLYVVMLSVVIMDVVMLTAVMFSVVILCVMMNVVMHSIVILDVVELKGVLYHESNYNILDYLFGVSLKNFIIQSSRHLPPKTSSAIFSFTHLIANRLPPF
jgi:hypothetical protein